MPILNQMPEYSALENALLSSMDNTAFLTYDEKELQPQQYKAKGSHFQNVHKIELDADLNTWNNGAWFILKPRFFRQLFSSEITHLNPVIASILNVKQVYVSLVDIHQAVRQNPKIDGCFNAFIMMKIMMEKLDSPQRPQIVEDIWAVGKADTLEMVETVFTSLQGIIAKILMNSVLQSIAVETGRDQRRLKDPDQNMDPVGLCDCSQKDLEVMTELLSSLPGLPIVHAWLSRHEVPAAKILAQLLNAIIKKPPNVSDFLKALTLQNGSAQQFFAERDAELARLERERQVVRENNALASELNLRVTVLTSKLSVNQTPQHLAVIETLSTNLSGFMLQLCNGDITRTQFKDSIIETLTTARQAFHQEPKWYTPLDDFIKNIENFFISFVYNPLENPQRFFKLHNEDFNNFSDIESKAKDLPNL